MAMFGDVKIGQWRPGKTATEMFQDPWRAGRAGLTGGLSEQVAQIEKIRSPKDVIGQNPLISAADVITPTQVTNPYEAQLQKAMAQSVQPDFAQAAKAGAAQGAFASELQKLYGTGAQATTDLISQLQKARQGDFGPGGSLAQAILQQGLSQNVGNVRSQLASTRGLSPALAAQMAAQQTAQMGGQTAQQAGILGLQQQLAAQQQLGQLAGQAATTGGGLASQLMTQQRAGDIEQAKASSDAALKQLQILASSDVGIRQIQAQTGMNANEIKAKIAAANQAAAMGDRQMVAGILGSLISSGAQVGASAVAAYDGGRIDGDAEVSGDSPKNDIVPAMLSPGEIVIPRSAAQDKAKAKRFLDELDGWDSASYAKVLKARRGKQ